MSDFERDVARYRQQMLTAAIKITHNRDDAEDCVSSVILKAWRLRDNRDPSQSYGGYLVTAAKRAALDLIRQRRRKQAEPLENHATTLADLAAVPVLVDDGDGERLVMLVSLTVAHRAKKRPVRRRVCA